MRPATRDDDPRATKEQQHVMHRPLAQSIRLGALGFGVAFAGIAAPALAGSVADQPNDVGSGYTSQDFPDFPDYTGSCFDDFALSATTALGALVVYGSDSFAGGGSANLNVIARIFTAPNLEGSALATVSGSQSGSDLSFDFTGVTLDAGTYWLSAQVVRPFNEGGQWFWNVSSTMNGAQAMYHNPNGGFGFGTDPVPITTLGATAYDLAFYLEGSAVPAPAAGFLVGALAFFRRVRR